MSNEPKEGSVTAPQEPLKLTLEEILVAIEREAYATLVPIPARGRTTAHSWTVTDLTDQSSFKNSHDFETLSEAASFALGRPVVARDDAAELRAALREWAEATRAAEWFELDQTNAYGDDHIDAEDRVEAARRALLALAATEGRGD